MKTSAMMFIPRKHQKRVIMYITASMGVLSAEMPGNRI